MRIRTKSACCALLTVAAVTSLALGGLEPIANAAAGSAITTVDLSLTNFSSLVADSAHQHLFISGGSGSDGVLVTDFAGHPVTNLTGLAGASALALSADGGILYAAITGTDEIAAVNTATLQEVALYFTDGQDPASLAVVGDDVWFSYVGTYAYQAGLGVLEPAALTVDLTGESAFYGAPVLAASPAAPGILVAGNEGSEPSVVESFDVSSGSPVSIAESDPWFQADGCEFVDQMAITANGTDVVTACGAPYHGSALNLDTMAEDATYDTGPYDESVAVASTGRIALGVDATSSSVYVFNPTGSAPAATYKLGGFGVYGIAWNSDGSTLFAVAEGGESPTLNIIDTAD